MVNISPADVFFWVMDHKWWIIALVPIAIVLLAMRARG